MSELPKTGDSAHLDVAVTADLLERFADYSGDRNPMHFDDAYARARGLDGRVAHGVSYAAFVSTLIGEHLPGPGALWLSQSIRFLAPVRIGETVRLTATVASVSRTARTVDLDLSGAVLGGGDVMAGSATVMMPAASGASADAPAAAAARRDGDPVAYIFGGTGALGSAIAQKLAGQGWRIALFGRRAGAAAEAASGIDGGRARGFGCDLSDPSGVSSATASAKEALGTPAALIHAASAPLGRSGVLETDAASFDAHMAVQLYGLRAMIDACAADMIAAGGGALVYIGSSAARGAPPDGMAAYTAAKAAAASYARSVALELGPKGLRANILSPDFLETALTDHVPDRARKLAAAKTPLRRLATLAEVAGVAAFLAGADAAYMNGEDILLDGGQRMI